ncbi:unnamed protein product [Rhizophagus irregularis]|nr:unnamed protein product [Rhizophagus irregularis]
MHTPSLFFFLGPDHFRSSFKCHSDRFRTFFIRHLDCSGPSLDTISDRYRTFFRRHFRPVPDLFYMPFGLFWTFFRCHFRLFRTFFRRHFGLSRPFLDAIWTVRLWIGINFDSLGRWILGCWIDIGFDPWGVRLISHEISVTSSGRVIKYW